MKWTIDNKGLPSWWSFIVFQTLVYGVYGILVGQFIYGMRDCFYASQKGKVRNVHLFLKETRKRKRCF